MAVFRIEIVPVVTSARDELIAHALRQAGLVNLRSVRGSRLVYLQGNFDRAAAERVAKDLLSDPVVEAVAVAAANVEIAPAPAECVAVEVHRRPGVMDPEAASILAELSASGLAVDGVRTGRRYLLEGAGQPEDVQRAAQAVLANDCVDQITVGALGVAPPPEPPRYAFQLRTIPLRDADGEALDRLSRDAHLFLSGPELRAIQAYFRALGRDPTDVELETLAQSWSEHCIHKTLRSAVRYCGTPLPTDSSYQGAGRDAGHVVHEFGNLLRETIVQATENVSRAGRGPECLSVFTDNAGVIAFDDDHGIAFKVETHNHPSAIEPYGGSTTGIGGVIRDIIGCGLGARPIASTDVFCVAPTDWPQSALPRGVLHPARLLRGLVQGVADYGNRMGIPTVNGAVCYDPRFLANPLVYCGCVGLIPRDRLSKAADAGDWIVLIGGRTGRDGIHGATFSSAELTNKHANEFSHAVQIGNAITEKRLLDAVLTARDAEGGCLYTAITDCGAGGLSSAVGEMGAQVGAVVDLDRVPLKYPGLRYDEIWISEAQERMVLAVPERNLERLLQVMAAEETEATVIGRFGDDTGRAVASPRLILRYQGQTVGDLEMHLVHHGLPREMRVAEWTPDPGVLAALASPAENGGPGRPALQALATELRRPVIASKEWIIRQYDHEVQGGSAIKPLMGPGRGPADAAVLRPLLRSNRAIAVGCGLAPHLSDVDPYWMAVAAVDEAVRNVVSVGGDPRQTALLDNFCWGRTDDPRQMGALVRACRGCHDVAVAYGMPFISGKDSLNNEFALDPEDIDPLLSALRAGAMGSDRDARYLRAILPALEKEIRSSGRLRIPPTLLISALAIVGDVGRCATPDLKRTGSRLVLAGGLPELDFPLATAMRAHCAVAEAIRTGLVCSCHDVSDGGWLVAAAEMALAGRRGLVLEAPAEIFLSPYDRACAGYLVESVDWPKLQAHLSAAGVSAVILGVVTDECVVRDGDNAVGLAALAEAWQAGSSRSGTTSTRAAAARQHARAGA